MKNIIYIMLIFGLTSCTSCEKEIPKPTAFIKLKNNSDKELLLYYHSGKDTILINPNDRDTPFHWTFGKLSESYFNNSLVKPQSEKTIPTYRDLYTIKDKPVIFYIFNRADFGNYKWAEMPILRRYKLTDKVLDSMKWEIIYP